MNLRSLRHGGKARRVRAFTLTEVMVGSGIGLLVAVAGMSFLFFSGRAVSGVTAQTVLNQQAGNTIEFIQSRVRFATSISNNANGNILTLGFDDDYTVDSDGDGKTYNDKDHYEQFKFIGTNSTNSTGCGTNSLVYIPNISSTNSRTLIPKGVRNLPGCNIFTLTNSVIVVIRFGVVDSYAGDSYQAVDVQGTGVSLNRPSGTNVLSIIP